MIVTGVERAGIVEGRFSGRDTYVECEREYRVCDNTEQGMWQ